MNFREATDDLCEGISHEELAKALGVSVATVRQARLRADAKAHRSPPDYWVTALIRLAEERRGSYQALIDRLKTMDATGNVVSSNPRHALSSMSRERRHATN